MQNRYIPQGAPAVLYGEGALEHLGAALDACGAGRVLLVTTGSLSAGPLVESVVHRLGARWAGTFATCRQHTPAGSVVAGAKAFADRGADALVSLGGGSAVDTAKGIAITAAVGEDLSAFHAKVTRDLAGMPVMRRGAHHEALTAIAGKPPVGGLAPHVAIPTTLSGAEYTDHAGITDPRGEKHQVYHRQLVPVAVVLDPWAAAHTPAPLWLSTGVKVLDHVVEIVYSRGTSPASQALCLAALRRAVANLADSADPHATQARHELQLAAWLAVAGYPNQAAGISHAVDHQLGALCDVAHGIGACCLLPHAIRFNADAARGALTLMAEEVARGGPRGGDTALGPASPATPATVVATAVERLVADLGLPSRLRDVGVAREVLPQVASQALGDPTIAGNPRVVRSAEEILHEMLEPAW